MRQAERATPEQIARHIEQQRQGRKPEFSDMHPIADAVMGAAALALFIGGMVGMWIKVGAGV